MGVNATYKVSVKLAPDDIADFDKDYFFYRLRKQVPNARNFLQEDGRPTGNDGCWDTIAEDLKAFSIHYRQVLIEVEVEEDYDGIVESRLYVQNGKSVEIEPIITWPAFSPEMLS